MELLDAVNLMMPKLGDRPVSSLNVRNPTLALIMPILDSNRQTLLGRGWWFNKRKVDAYPDPSGRIVLAGDVLSFVPAGCAEVALLGNTLYNTATNSDIFDGKVSGTFYLDIPFNLLPDTAARYVMWASLVEAVVTDLGVSSDSQTWAAAAAAAWSQLLEEHLRQRKLSTRDSPAWHRLRRALRS